MAEATNTRKPIPKRLRFEVFKRDKFMCQYCGALATAKILHCDHVVPVAEGGETTLLNLTTACKDCNLGKGARLLSDDTVLSKQHAQLADLEERRQQLEMMRQWREELEKHAISEVDILVDAIGSRSEWTPGDVGRNTLRRLIKKHGLVEVLEAAGEAFDIYFRDGTESDWDNAFGKIGLVIKMRAGERENPALRKILYIQGILRNRFSQPREDFVDRLKDIVAKKYPVETMEQLAKRATSWNDYVQLLNKYNAALKAQQTEPEEDEVDRLQAQEDAEMEESMNAWHDDAWHIEMWAGCFGDTSAARILKVIAGWTRGSGFVDRGDISAEVLRLLFGLHAVGLIRPTRKDGSLAHRNENGDIVPTFQVPPLSPREATRAFNRFCTLKLGHWGSPLVFARVDQVH